VQSAARAEEGLIAVGLPAANGLGKPKPEADKVYVSPAAFIGVCRLITDNPRAELKFGQRHSLGP